MPAEKIKDFKRLCVHTITTKPWPLDEAVRRYAAAGIKGITVWRDTLEGSDIAEAGRRIRDAGLDIVAFCRGGFFPGKTKTERMRAVENNLRCIDEAAELGAPLIALVCGAVPGIPLTEARKQIREGIASILPHAESNKIKLAVEPIHPMYADSRSAVNTMAQANAICDALPSPYLGVAVDVYHTWWDPDLEEEIHRCGSRIFAFHISDWKTPTEDLLLDRGLMGEGCIPIRKIRGWVESSGFSGYNEVEIFSKQRWKTDQKVFLDRILEAYLKNS